MQLIDGTLDVLQLQPQRRPRWKVEVYDVRSAVSDTIGTIVRELTLETITGPLEITNMVEEIVISRSSGDFVSSGIPGSRMTMRFIDPHNQFNWFNQIAAPTGNGRWLRRNNVIRITEGDADVDEDKWVLTFTGLIVGQAGVDQNRTTGTAAITVEAVGREVGFLKTKQTSQTFPAANTYIETATTLAQADMGLDIDEIDFSGWGAQDLGHAVTQFVDQETIVALAQLMFVDGFMPRFNGAGILGQVQGLITASPARTYFNDNIIQSVIEPFHNETPVNRVCVVGLDKDMSKISQPVQEIGRVDVTVGYFTNDKHVKVYWSPDRTSLADNIDFVIERSINGGLSTFGTEDFVEIETPNSGEGTIGGTITIGTGFAPYLIVLLTIAYIATAWIPDLVEAVGFVANVGITNPIGRAVQAALMVTILLLMSQIGNAIYRIDGTPFEYVFKEIRACAEIDNLLTEEFNEVVIDNHLVNNQTDADNTARDVLFRQQARGRPRSIRGLLDLRLEPDDTIELANNRRYLIESMTHTLKRDAESVPVSMSCFEVTAGIGSLV